MAQAGLLSVEDKQTLLHAARRTLEVFLSEQRTPVIEHSSEALLQQRGAFVSLHKGKHLRGCIGTFVSQDPLLETVQRMTIAAATTDPRFPKVEPIELDQIHLEISALSPLTKATPEEIEVGTHGIYITKGSRRGVLLPQVATENKWDRIAFLEHTCMKAGLDTSAWQDDGTVIEIFSAEVFGEEER